MPLKRTTSLLRRLRGQTHGSFRQEVPPERSNPTTVRRSHSLHTAHAAKPAVTTWVDHEEDLQLVSAPSFPRSIGRMVDTLHGRIHVVELHRPPFGIYGVYITEGNEGGVFVSRFANSVARKFYSGLLSEGDELVAVNGEKVRGKSLDYVYDVLARLDTVVLTVVPVGSRLDW